jgi:hypothetical protein
LAQLWLLINLSHSIFFFATVPFGGSGEILEAPNHQHSSRHWRSACETVARYGARMTATDSEAEL